MQTWILTPIDPSAPSWASSTWSSAVVVRADSDERAREIAALAFGIWAEKIHQGDTPLGPPWYYEQLVTAERGDDQDGEEAILEPAHHDAEWRK